MTAINASRVVWSVRLISARLFPDKYHIWMKALCKVLVNYHYFYTAQPFYEITRCGELRLGLTASLFLLLAHVN